MNLSEGEDEDDFGNFEGADVHLEFNYDLFDRIVSPMELQEEIPETNLIDLLSSTRDSFKRYNQLTSDNRQISVDVPLLAVNTQNQMRQLNTMKEASSVVNNWISEENRDTISKSDLTNSNIFQWRIDGVGDAVDYTKEQEDHNRLIDTPQKNLSEMLLKQASKSCNRLQVQRQLEQRKWQQKREKKLSNTPEVDSTTNKVDTGDNSKESTNETKKRSKWVLFGNTKSKKSVQISKDHIKSDSVKVEKDNGLAFKDELNFKEYKSKNRRRREKLDAEGSDTDEEEEEENANDGYAILGENNREVEEEEDNLNDFSVGGQTEAAQVVTSFPPIDESGLHTKSIPVSKPTSDMKPVIKNENLIDL